MTNMCQKILFMEYISGAVSYSLFRVNEKSYHMFGDYHCESYDCTDKFKYIPYNYVNLALEPVDNNSNISDFCFVLDKFIKTHRNVNLFIECPVIKNEPQLKSVHANICIRRYRAFADSKDKPLNSKNIADNNTLMQATLLSYFNKKKYIVLPLDKTFSKNRRRCQVFQIDYRRYDVGSIDDPLCLKLYDMVQNDYYNSLETLDIIFSEHHDHMKDYLLQCLSNDKYMQLIENLQDLLKDKISFIRVDNKHINFGALDHNIQQIVIEYFDDRYLGIYDKIRKLLPALKNAIARPDSKTDFFGKLILSAILKKCVVIEMDTYALCKILLNSNKNNVIVAGADHCKAYADFFTNYLKVHPEIILESEKIQYNKNNETQSHKSKKQSSKILYHEALHKYFE